MSTKQHYLPRFWLRNFTTLVSNKHWFYQFDKQNNKWARLTPSNVCHENGYYDWHFPNGHFVRVDDVLTKADDSYAPILSELCSNPTPQTLENNKEAIARLLAFQRVRCKSFRKQIEEMDDSEKVAVLEASGIPKDVALQLSPKDRVKAVHLLGMKQNAIPVAKEFYRPQWTLLYNNTGTTFRLADEPFFVDDNNLFVPLKVDLALLIDANSLQGQTNDRIVSIEEVERINLGQFHNAFRFLYSCDDNFDCVPKSPSDTLYG